MISWKIGQWMVKLRKCYISWGWSGKGGEGKLIPLEHIIYTKRIEDWHLQYEASLILYNIMFDDYWW